MASGTHATTWSSELLTNPGFETGDATGWNGSGQNMSVAYQCENNCDADPHSGSYVAYWNTLAAPTNYSNQTVDLTAYASDIDAGNAIITATGWFISDEIPAQDLFYMQVLFYDGSSSEIVADRYDSGTQEAAAWTQYGITDYTIPTGARSVEIRFNTWEVSWGAGSADDFSVKVGVYSAADYDVTYSFTTRSEAAVGWVYDGPGPDDGLNVRDSQTFWCWTDTGSPSTGTGPPSGVPCVYTESSTGTAGDEYIMTLASAVDASVYDLYVTFDTSTQAQTAGTLYFEAYNGSTWVGIDSWSGDSTTTFTSRGPYDFTAYNNSDFKIRFRVVTGGTTYQNDFAIDEVRIYGDSSTLDLTQIHYRWRNDDGPEGYTDWWDTNYLYRKKVTFGINHSALFLGHTASVSMDTQPAATNVALASGNDVRIVWQPDAGAPVELDRIGNTWNNAATTIEFRLQSGVAANFDEDADGSYYIYYGNASAGTPPTDEMKVYYFADFFNRANNTIVGNGWTEWNTGGGNMLITSNTLYSQGNNVGPPDAGLKQTFPLGAILGNFTLSFDWTMPSNPEGIWTHYLNIGNSAVMVDTSRTIGVGPGIFNGEGAHFNPNGIENVSNDLTGNMENNVTGGPHSIRMVVDAGAQTYDYWRGGAPIASGQSFVTAEATLDQIRIANDQYINAAAAFVYDNLKIVLDVADPPEETAGTEENITGGATFAADEDTALTGIVIGTMVRLRFQVSNEGGLGSGPATYQLQVAETGTCGSGTYTTVPTDTSGHWQVADSSYVTDGGATANISPGLTDEGSTFVAGELKDAGNTTGSIPLGGDQFTEIEFALTATDNATDTGDYCFQLYNTTAGATLDTYAVYAQVTLANGIFSYRKPITIPVANLGGSCVSDLTDFPVLISLTDPDLAGKARDDGFDIIFRALDDGTCGGAGAAPCHLDHEIESWDGSTGALVAWVKLPVLSSSADTTIYMYYGNPAVTESTQNSAAVWDSNYEGVWHLEETVTDEGTTGTHEDSTSTPNNGSQMGNDDVTGQIASGQQFDGGNDYIDLGTGCLAASNWSLEFWLKPATPDNYERVFIQGDTGCASRQIMAYWHSGHLEVRTTTTGAAGDPQAATAAITNNGTTWSHFVWTNNGAVDTLYVNGQTSAGAATGLGVGIAGENNIGRRDAGSYWTGGVDEVRLSNTARPACWIETEYSNQNNPGNIGVPGFYTMGAEETSPPTAVELISFEATGQDGSVMVEWETAQEIDNMGFNLYRGPSPWGPFTRLTDKLIAGLSFSVMGKAYSYEDKDVTPGKLYYYKLEDLDTSGKRTFHGPICVDWDGDGMADDWEIAYGLDPTVDDSMLDPDGDGLTNLEEYEFGIEPLNPDTDGDGIPDGEESRKRNPEEITVGRTLTQGVQIIESDAEGITLELRTDSFEARTVQAEGQGFERLRITEYIHGFTDEVGKPELPMKGILLDIPEGKSATLTVLETDDQIHSGYRVYPVPEKAVDDQAHLSHVGEVFVVDEAAYSQDTFYPEVVADLGETYFFRGQQKQQILLSPLTFNPATGEIRHHRRIRVRLIYVDGGLAKAAGPKPTIWSPSVGDDGSKAFSSMVKMAFLAPSIIVNPIASVLSSAAILARALWAPPSAAEPAYKILIVEEGIYRLTKSWLEANGVDVSEIDLSQVRLYNLGEEVAIRVEDGGVAGQFDDGDSIEFYATPVESQYGKYAKNNVYWLTSSGGSGTPKRMAAVDTAPGSGTVAGSHSFTVHHEEDHWYLLGLPGGDSLERWSFFPFVDGDGIGGGGAPVDFTLTLPGVAGQGSVKISMVGLYDTDHAVDVAVNGTYAGSFSWSGIAYYLATINGVVLVEGDNIVTLTCTSGEDSIAVDWFEVTYPRSFAASNETLKFSHQAGYLFQVTGFTDDDLGVFDITSASEVQRLYNFQVSGSGPYSLEFEPVATGERSYLVLSSSAVKIPASIDQDSPSSLADPANGADYILITHRELGWDGSGNRLPWLSDLVTLRENQGLRVKVVDVEDIFDEFSYGIFTPQAVKDFLAQAYESWTRPAPQYLLFVGDSTYDPKGNWSWMLADATSTYLPTYLTATKYMGETMTDEWFARVSGDDAVPDLYIGRLPAVSAAEASVMVNKIITYENGTNSKSWEKNVLLVADNQIEDYEAVFELMNEDAASLLPAGMNAPFRGYLDDYLVAGDLTAEIKGKVDEGALVINYSGHGSTQIWANEHIFETGDVADLGNDDKLPFLVGMSCLTGYFGYPESWSFPSLGEAMLRSEDKGAVAAFMPTGMTSTEGQHILNTALFEAIFNDDIRILGPAISSAKQTLLANGGSEHEEVSETFLLFGDPAMKLKNPLPTRPSGVMIEGDTSGLTVSWQEATDCNGNPVVGYNVYRSTSPGGSYEKVNDSLITGTQHVDTPSLMAATTHAKVAVESGTTYYYVVTSVDSDDDESVYSEEQSVTAGGGSQSEDSSGGGGGGGCFINTAAGF